MKKKTANAFPAVCSVLLLLLPVAAFAAGEAEDDGYTVRKGDTLWEISSEKLKDPFSWTRIWEANPQIKNPHWIYPGQKLLIPSGAVGSEKTGKADETSTTSSSKKSSTEIRPGENAVVKHKVEKIPSVKTSYIVSKEVFMKVGYIVSDIPAIGRIASSPEGRSLMAAGDPVYLDVSEPLADNSLLYIVSKPEALTRPGSDVPIGYAVGIKGTMRTVERENGNYKGVILDSNSEIQIGDLLARYVPLDPPLTPTAERRPPINGTIIKIREDRRLGAKPEIVYLDIGADAGVQVGDLFNVVTAHSPHVPVGTLRIISKSPSASTAIIATTVMEVTLGDLVGN